MSKRTPTWYELKIPKIKKWNKNVSNCIKNLIEEAMSYNELILFPYENAIQFFNRYIKLNKMQFDFLNCILKLNGKIINSKDLISKICNKEDIIESSDLCLQQVNLLKTDIECAIKSVILEERHGVEITTNKNRKYKSRRIERYKKGMQSKDSLCLSLPVADDVRWIRLEKPLHDDYIGYYTTCNFKEICSMLIKIEGDNCFSEFKRGKMPLKKCLNQH